MANNTRGEFLRDLDNAIKHCEWIEYHLQKRLEAYVEGAPDIAQGVACVLELNLESRKLLERIRETV